MTRTKRPCSVCGRPDVLRKGMCPKHYQRQRVHGDPTIVGTPGRKAPLPGLLAQCGDCGTTVGLVATPAGVWGPKVVRRPRIHQHGPETGGILMSEPWMGLHNPERHEPHSGIDVYRVQVGKPWWRRKWQAEWELCHFAQRGYTRRGVLAMARLRRTHARVNDAYVRARIIIRRNVTQRGEWYAARYTVTGARHSADGRGGGAR